MVVESVLTLARTFSFMTLQLMIGRLRIGRWLEVIVDFSLQNRIIFPIRLNTALLSGDTSLKAQKTFFFPLASH